MKFSQATELSETEANTDWIAMLERKKKWTPLRAPKKGPGITRPPPELKKPDAVTFRGNESSHPRDI